jgi:hypothetical protein
MNGTADDAWHSGCGGGEGGHAVAGTEQRQHPRQPVFLDCEIDGASDFATMRISNLSLAGCYVDTGMSVGVGAGVRLRLVLAGTPARSGCPANTTNRLTTS